jgi:predicted nucleotidyltransferase component of viral defense system
MIPLAYITAWRPQAPWVEGAQVEQDLIISRALVDIFSQPPLRESLAFRGGTALYKLHISPPARYSEDIDLVQIKAGPIGPILDQLRSVLDPWLGEPRRRRSEGRASLIYRFDTENTPSWVSRLKIEINTREHETLFGFIKKPYAVSSEWFSGEAEITTYELDELMGTKLRALYQRRKGRDVFDLALALRQPEIDAERVVEAFSFYLKQGGHTITHDQFKDNLAEKLKNKQFTTDLSPLLAGEYESDIRRDVKEVSTKLIDLLPRL